jgi:cysteine desulfurase
VNAFFDHNATTPVDGRVLEAMLPYLSEVYGNPSSVHRQGRAARDAIERAREQVAELVAAHPSQVVFTSGGTEGNNAVLKGIAWRNLRGRVAVSAIEHASLLEPAQVLVRLGWEMDSIPSGRDGRVSPDAVRATLTPETRLVSVMLANNETGVIQDLEAIAEVLRGHPALLHTDAVQAAGKMPLNFAATGAQLMTLSAHKIYGPKGVGALVVDKSVEWEPLLSGGGQEKGRRGGTENLAGIVGFGAAAEFAREELGERTQHLRRLRDRFEMELRTQLPEVVIFAGCAERLPNTVFMALPGIDGEALLMNMDRQGFALSSGAACAAEVREPSHVLRAMGIEPELARSAVRVSFGRDNTAAQVDALVNALCKQQASLKAKAW